MYTSTIISSYNTIANAEHTLIMKPPVKKQPRKPRNFALESRGNSADTDSPNFVNLSLLPEIPQVLPGLECLASLQSVNINPDKMCGSEYRNFGFTVDADGGERILKCVPTDPSCCNSARSLSFQTVNDVPILDIKTDGSYCCSLFTDREAKLTVPAGRPFGSIVKTAYGACNCGHKYTVNCFGNDTEKIVYEVDNIILSPSEFRIKRNDEVVAKMTSQRSGCWSFYKLSFTKEELSPNLKGLFIVFAMVSHIISLENVNTCNCMCMCFAGVWSAALVLWCA